MKSSRLSATHALSVSRFCLAACLAVACTSCGASQTQVVGVDAAGLARTGDWDGAVAAYRAELDAAPSDDARATIRQKLDEATAHAVGQHVDAGHQALAAHDLAGAEAQYQKAGAMRADDPRVVAGNAATSDVRARGTQAVATARKRLTTLSDHAQTLADRPEWAALIKDLEWLSQWPRDFPDGATLWREARTPVAAFLVLDAKDLVKAGKPMDAEARAQKALAWSPGQPDAFALIESLRAANDFQQRVVLADADLQAGRLEQALTAFEALVKLPQPPPEAVTGLRETKKRLVADLLLRAKDQRGGKNWAMAMRLAGRAKAMAAEDTSLNAEVSRVYIEAHEKLVSTWQKPMTLALKKKLPAAALLYANMILSVSPTDKDARKVRAKWAGKVAALAATHLEIVAGGSSDESAKKKKARKQKNPEPVAVAPSMPGLNEALISGVRRGLAAAGLDRAGIAIVSGKKAKAEAKLVLNVTSAKLERTSAPEARSKNYLDHVEIVENPAWADAQARQSSALLALNVALQEVRPVQEALNEGERELYNQQQQLGEIRKKITEEDTAYYATQPTPCPDGSLNCDGTRGKVRWRANVDYYEKQLQRQQAHVAELGPKRVKLQAAVDEKQAAYDAAQKVALDTPKRAPKEMWQPYEYQVEHQTYVAQAALSAKLEVAPASGGKKPHGKKKKAAGAPPFGASSSWQQSGEDFATGVIQIKGQVLEPNHPSALPSDVTVVNQVADKLLAPVVPAVVAEIGAHGERFVKAAAATKENLAKVDQLALAWLTSPGLPPTVQEQVRDQLAILTAWLPQLGRLDAGAIAYDKLPAIK